ncbi:hypothetical protein H6G76_17715 [Nostoc sp. FACHB-152]|uniref:hypothetical protein n=1 Tax=unclassified Nostoc TaxID=2593658 RepID=UPI001687F71E|nr:MULTISPECIES: hypothetical protein [unclassified Nostoc]MBD2448958.1 hypothetical protein [Nostoc sp. FACHB-152]MBD2469426.1 hypothetical protein [Nostoc sp. FACHB-145]
MSTPESFAVSKFFNCGSVVAKAVDEIESNPTLKARVIGALKAGGTEAFNTNSQFAIRNDATLLRR